MANSTSTTVLPSWAPSSNGPPAEVAASPDSLPPDPARAAEISMRIIRPPPPPLPQLEQTYVDPSEPTTSGAPGAFGRVYAPNFFKGMLDALTFLGDVPTMGAGYVMGAGARALGFPETAKSFEKPVLLGDIAKGVFEAPASIETAITGEAATITSGFSATPLDARTPKEKFFRDLFYVSGGALSLPTALGAAFGTFRAPVQKLLSEAGGRSVNSEAARKAIDFASNAKGPNAPQALVEAARQYASKYTSGLSTATTKTIAVEQALATAAGIGYGAPELFADKDGKIMLDIGEGAVDMAPTIKVLSSMGLPILVQHTPAGLVVGGGSGVVNLLKYVRNKGLVLAKSLVSGASDSGRLDMASRIFNAMESEPGVLENVFLPAVESGQFRSPGSSTPIKILEDGTVVPEYGGINPDTRQALKILGVDDTRLASLDSTLRGRGTHLQERLSEEARRAGRLDESFELLRSHLGSGDEASAYRAIEKARNNLDDEALDALDVALARARDVFEALEPSIGRAEASKAAVEMLEGAREASRAVTRKLFDKELIGTEYVDTRNFGDWAIRTIQDMGERNIAVTPGMGIYYKLAGQKRLQEAGLLPSGKPITDADLGGVKGTGDEALTAAEIPENGLYDIFGEAGTIYAEPVRIETVFNFRSEIGDLARSAYKAGNQKLGRRFSLIIDYVDDEVLAAKNFEGKVAPENIRNIEIGREYVMNAKARFGPNSEIGKLLFKGDDKIDEGFLTRLLKTGPEAGARVELFRNALNEPQQVIQNGKATWQRDPAAALTVGDNPNVVEADLILRFTEGLAGGTATQKNVDRFLTKYSEAVDKIPGLRDRFNDLKAVQQAADVMTSKLTVPDRGTVLAAVRSGATIEDVANARRILRENLNDRQLANTASDYLNADVDKAASSFINADPKHSVKRSEEIAALLAKDGTGEADRGFRAALWRSLRNASRRVGPDGEPEPGIDTKKFTETIERNRPYLEKFFNKSAMEFLDELVKGGSIQRTGTMSPLAGSAGNLLQAEFGTVEAVGAAGRSLGQRVFGAMGVNTLAAASTGKRIAAYTFTKIGEAKIFKHVEDALRDPEKAAFLVRRYRDLKKWEPSPKAKQLAGDAIADPFGTATGAKDRLVSASGFAGKYLKGHSQGAVERAVRFGLIPAQGEGRRRTLEEDWETGWPYALDDNLIRRAIENDPRVGPESSVRPAGPPPRRMGVQFHSRPPVPSSSLSQARHFPSAMWYHRRREVLDALDDNRIRRAIENTGEDWETGQQPAAPPGPAGPPSPDVVQQGQQLFGANDSVFGPGFRHGGYVAGGAGSGAGRMEKSGIMSVPRKPRQLVG